METQVPKRPPAAIVDKSHLPFSTSISIWMERLSDAIGEKKKWSRIEWGGSAEVTFLVMVHWTMDESTEEMAYQINGKDGAFQSIRSRTDSLLWNLIGAFAIKLFEKVYTISRVNGGYGFTIVVH